MIVSINPLGPEMVIVAVSKLLPVSMSSIEPLTAMLFAKQADEANSAAIHNVALIVLRTVFILLALMLLSEFILTKKQHLANFKHLFANLFGWAILFIFIFL